MNKLFKNDILTVDIPVQGETDNYIVKITFGGFLEILRDQLRGKDTLDYRDISRACIIGFNRDDVFISCTCPDQTFRYNFWATKNNTNSGVPELRPSNITNPNDTLGSGCKHILLVLSNNSWVLRVARVIKNYIEYMQKHYQKLYADVIYPAIFGKKYIEPVQLGIEDETELVTDKDTISKATQAAREKGRFQKGNVQGVRFAPNEETEDQLEIEENPDDEL